ncbi:unnamed protein product [Oikopleura dioica]|uniref:Uncharacterized protein n=1 Tax=Oikopleura dioica TaxID=34765 RepID=E4WU41_OIKDI|nr:unnamed protein product [Oikopleura dioica]
MLEPKHKDYAAVKIMDVTSSSDSESESEIATPSVSNLKSRFSVKNGGDKPLVIQPIHEPVIRREPLYLRNRFHKEPTNQEDIIRSDQPGTKEKPEYSFNVGDLKKQFTGAAPKISRPITEPLPNKSTGGMSRTKSAPLQSSKDAKDVASDVEIVRSQAGVREEAVKPQGGLAAIRSQWENNVEESIRGRARSRRPDPINLKEEAKEVKIRDKSQRRESRHARRAASTGRGAAMKIYDDGASNRREESKSPPRRKKTPAPVKKEVKKEVKVEKPVQVVETAKPKSPVPAKKLVEDEKAKAVGVEEAFDLMSVDRSRATSVPTIGSPTESNRTDVKDDFDLLNGDSFNDPSTVKDIKKDIKESYSAVAFLRKCVNAFLLFFIFHIIFEPEEVISTKSSVIDFEEPSVQEIVPKKEEINRSNENKSVPQSPLVPEPLEIIETPQEQVFSQVESSSVTPSLPNLSENLPSSTSNQIIDELPNPPIAENAHQLSPSLERTSSGWIKVENDASSESESFDTLKTESTIALAIEPNGSDEDQKTTASGISQSSHDLLEENSQENLTEVEEKIEEKKIIDIKIKEENSQEKLTLYAEYTESDYKEENLMDETKDLEMEEDIENLQYENATKALSDIDSEIYNEPLSNISEATEELSPNDSFSKDMNIQTTGNHQPVDAPLEVLEIPPKQNAMSDSSSSSDEEEPEQQIQARRTIGFAPEIEILNESTDDEIVEICSREFKPTNSREPTPPGNLTESSSDYDARSSDEESTDPEVREAIQKCSMEMTEKIINDSLAQVKNESIIDDFDLLGDLGSVSTPNAPPGGATSNNFDLLA